MRGLAFEDFVLAAAIFAFPTILHMQFLFGSALLEPVKTGSPLFDRFFNRRPLAISLVAGTQAALAYLLWNITRPLGIGLLGFALLLFAVDMAAASVSYYKHVRKRR